MVWSPDGTKILGVFKSHGKTEIFYLKMDNNSLVMVTEKKGSYQDPVWSHDGSKIAFGYMKPAFGESGIESGVA